MCNRRNTMNTEFTSIEELPLTLNVKDVASVLRISKAMAYNVMRSQNFPVVFIGKRMIVAKSKFIIWLDESSIN